MKRIVHGLSNAVGRAPVAVLIVTILLFLVFGAFSGQQVIDQGNESFSPDNPELRALEVLGAEFEESGAEEVLQVVIVSDDGDVLDRDGLQTVLAVQQTVEAEVGPFLVSRPERPAVVSYLAPVLQAAQEAGLSPDQLDDATIKQLYQQALAEMPPEQSGLFAGLISERSTGDVAPSGLMLLFLDGSGIADANPGEDPFAALIDTETELAEAIRTAGSAGDARAEPFAFALLFGEGGGFEDEVFRLLTTAILIILVILSFVYLVRSGGTIPRLFAVVGLLAMVGVTVLVALEVIPLWLGGLGFLAVFLTWALAGGGARRTAADTLLTLFTILMTITWMQGIGVLLGPDYLGLIGNFNPVTQIIPILLVGLGVDYAIHLTARYREEIAEGKTVSGAVNRSISTVGIALVLATVTTALGFLTNVVNPVPAVKDFGILSAVGIGAAFLLMLTFVPAVRLLVDGVGERRDRLPRKALSTGSDRLLPEVIARSAVLAERFPLPTLIVTLALGALGVYGVTQLDTRFSVTDFVSQDSPVLATFETIQAEYGGGFGETTQVLMEGDLATVEAFNGMVGSVGQMGGMTDVLQFGDFPAVDSPTGVVLQLVLPGPDGEPAVPEFAAFVQSEGLQPDFTLAPGADVSAVYDAARQAAPEAMARVLNEDATVGQMVIQTSAGEDRAADLRSDLIEALSGLETAGIETTPTSQNIVSAVIVQALQDSQLQSLGITLLAAMALLVANFWIESRRPLLGVITIAPVGLVVLWTFGMMAATGIPFGPVTATLAALAIGIGVPFTIHITHRFQEDRVRFTDPLEAIRSTARHTGGALAGSAFTTMAGFGILISSTLVPFQQMGLVTVFAIGFALIASVLVLPSMLALWDAWHRRRGHEIFDEAALHAAEVLLD